MKKNRRMVAFFTFGWGIAVAGVTALVLTTMSEASDLEAGGLADIQVGERGDQTRIAILCDLDCELEPRGDFEFMLSGAVDDLSLDLSDRTKNISALSLAPRGGGSLLRVSAESALDHSTVKHCTVGGRPAICLDLFFGMQAQTAQGEDPARIAQVGTPSAIPPAPREKPLGDETDVLKEPARPVAAEADSGLREAAPDRLTRFAELTPPERLQPPKAAVLAKVQPVEQSVAVGRPSIIAKESAQPETQFDFADQVKEILGKDLTPAFCNNAGATLEADPWALGALVDMGLCAAGRGDIAEAENMLSRLLEYTPDNYEAHVGRALIAAQAGEKSVARRYFQDALNTLPPIEESNRIVAAMDEL